MTLHLGKQDATSLRSGTVRYSELRQSLVKDSQVTLPTFPANFGHANAFPGDSWNMLGNGPDDSVFQGFQGCGDCAWAGPAHEIMESFRAVGKPVPAISGKTVVDQYSAYSGYDPETGANDTGSNVQDVLAWRTSKGFLDDTGTAHKIGQYIALTPGSLQELWEAVWLFERAGIGFTVQEAQQIQFGDNKPWDYVPGSPTVGGHYVPVMGRYGLVSWARRVSFTNRFYVNLNDEAFTYIDAETVDPESGKNADGFALNDLEKYIVLVARMKTAAA